MKLRLPTMQRADQAACATSPCTGHAELGPRRDPAVAPDRTSCRGSVVSATPQARIDALLDAWNAHQALRRGHAPIADLVASRERLDTVRAELRRVRERCATMNP